jgi:putative aldouronate transport system permease protein
MRGDDLKQLAYSRGVRSPSQRRQRARRELPLHLMLLPCVAIVLVYAYYPMTGIVIAFQRYNPTKGFFGSKWVGLENFLYLLNMPNTKSVLFNTVSISLMKMAAGLAVPVLFAVLLDLVRISKLRRSIQTIIYIPYFLSWVMLGGILTDILSPSTGIVNGILRIFGIKEVFFLANPAVFPFLLVVTDVWKNAGYGTVIYLAAITSIDQSQYEAARIDGANRLKQAWHVTLPGMMPIIVLMATLSLGNILNAGFEQVLSLYSPIVYSSGDILDTFIYRVGLANNQYSIATAAGFFKSLISFIFIAAGYRMAYKFAGYEVF